MANKSVSSSIPAYIFAGPHALTVARAEQHLMSLWCIKQGCHTCRACKAIKARNFYLLHWLVPEKQVYTVTQIDEVMRLLTMKRDVHEQVCIVFEYAHVLSISSASMLLKSLEEPAPGYCFILLTESIEDLLPTIISRCVIECIEGASEGQEAFLKLYCTLDTTVSTYAAFEKEREQIPQEHETRALVEKILAYWLERYYALQNKNAAAEAARALHIVKLLEDALVALPMPGSARLFWRSLFLKITFLSSADVTSLNPL